MGKQTKSVSAASRLAWNHQAHTNANCQCDPGVRYDVWHHADCYATPIAQDMVDLGVRIWQGVIPENDIVGIQKSLNDALPMQGGINVPAIDAEGMSEEKVRAEVRQTFDAYCENGRFFPGFPGGFCADKRVDDIARDEISKYGQVYVKNHYE